MNKIVIVDCDGTTLNKDGKISKFTYETLKEVSKTNTLIVATGRNLEGVKFAYNGFELIGDFIIACDGALVYDLKNKKTIYANKIAKSSILNIIKILNKYSLTRIDIFLGSGYNKIVEDKVVLLNEDDAIKLEVYFENFEDLKCAQKEINVLDNLSAHAQSVSISNVVWLTIINKNNSKGSALMWLANRFGFNFKDSICFADAGNDISMFKLCNKRIAVANAIDDIKKLATDITLSCNDDGVAHYLKTHIL